MFLKKERRSIQIIPAAAPYISILGVLSGAVEGAFATSSATKSSDPAQSSMTTQVSLPECSRGKRKAKTAHARRKPAETVSVFVLLKARYTAAAMRTRTQVVPAAPGYEPDKSAVTEKVLSLRKVPRFSISSRLVPLTKLSESEKTTEESCSACAGYANTYCGKHSEAKQTAAAQGTKGAFFSEPNGSLQTSEAKQEAEAPT